MHAKHYRFNVPFINSCDPLHRHADGCCCCCVKCNRCCEPLSMLILINDLIYCRAEEASVQLNKVGESTTRCQLRTVGCQRCGCCCCCVRGFVTRRSGGNLALVSYFRLVLIVLRVVRTQWRRCSAIK